MLIERLPGDARDDLHVSGFSRRELGRITLLLGMGAATMGWAATPEAGQTHLIASRDSYADFVRMAWGTFNTPSVDQLSAAQILNALYSYAAEYNPNHVAAKSPLAGTALYGAMATLIQATAPHTIRAQQGDWPDITGQVDSFFKYYTAKANGISPPVNELAEQLTQDYLHIYPNQQAPVNWRIILNVLPSDMAAAMAALAPLLNAYASAAQMKFLSPGNVDKADSVIVYCSRSDSNDYAALERAVLSAAANLNLQPRVGAMYEEIRPGIGVAAEPPMEGVSFTQFRCLIVYLAYRQYVAAPQRRGNPNFADFREFLAQAMSIFGLDVNSPYKHGPLQKQSPHFAQWWDALETLRRSWTG